MKKDRTDLMIASATLDSQFGMQPLHHYGWKRWLCSCVASLPSKLCRVRVEKRVKELRARMEKICPRVARLSS